MHIYEKKSDLDALSVYKKICLYQSGKFFQGKSALSIVAPGCLIRTNCKQSMLLLITDRIFIIVWFFFGDAVAYVFLETPLYFFQQFDRLACMYVSRAPFLGLFLDPLSILAPHDSKLRWFPHNIRAIMAKIKLPKNPHSIVIFGIKVLRSYQDLSS